MNCPSGDSLLAAVDQRSSICHVSDCSPLVLDSMDFRVSHMLSFVNKKKVFICYSCRQERNNPLLLHGNCMYWALYQFNMWFFLNQPGKKYHWICSMHILGQSCFVCWPKQKCMWFLFVWFFFSLTAPLGVRREWPTFEGLLDNRSATYTWAMAVPVQSTTLVCESLEESRDPEVLRCIWGTALFCKPFMFEKKGATLL